MKTLYHYCSTEIMSNIIKHNAIRLTDSYGLKDYTENKLVDEVAIEALTENGITAEEVKTHLATYHSNKNIPFVACFSDAPDLLSQWGEYGDGGKGVSIGFDLLSLKLPPTPPFRCDEEKTRFSLCKLDYLELDNIRDNLRESLNMWSNEIPDFKGGIDGPTRDDKIEFALKSAHINALSKKLIAFEEERETRLVFVPDADKDGNIVNYTDEKRLQGPSFFVSGNKLRCYFDYSFAERLELVTEIWLGPKCEIEESVLRSLLNSKEMNHIEIKRSSATYR